MVSSPESQNLVQHFINGKPISSSKTFQVKSPVDGNLVETVSAADDDTIEQAIASAQAAFSTWRDSTISERQSIYLKAQSLMLERRSDFVQAMKRETPIADSFSDFNMHVTPEIFSELAASVSVVGRGETINVSADEEALTYRVPFGVCFAAAPWNAPVLLGCRSFAAAIIAGNTVVFKTSELTPATHVLFGQLMKDAGLPDGVLNIIHVSAADAPKHVETIIADPRIRHVNFTGSTRVGSIIGALAGKYIKPVLLELGGKASAIVLEDADLDVAVSNIILGAWMHQGQICMSTEKAIILAPVYDAFVAKCKQVATDSGIIHNPLGHTIPAGAKKAKELVEDATGKGATLLLGPHDPVKANYMAPCILTGVTDAMSIYNEETFAPVFMILKAADEEEAIRLANDTEYGLSSAIFSRDVAKAIKLGRRIDSGATHINSMTVGDHPQVPHGGMKQSGFGRFNSVEGVKSFTQLKVVYVHAPHHIPL